VIFGSFNLCGWRSRRLVAPNPPSQQKNDESEHTVSTVRTLYGFVTKRHTSSSIDGPSLESKIDSLQRSRLRLNQEVPESIKDLPVIKLAR